MTAESAVEPTRGLGWRIGWTVAGLVPFAAISVVQLATTFTGNSRVDAVTKALEVPTLAIGLGVGIAVNVLTTKRKPRAVVVALLFIGLALSWVGDVTLGERFNVGLAAFLAAHLIYIALFAAAFPRRHSHWALLAIPWWVALVVVLGPRLGGMLPLVALYAAVLGLMAASSSRGNAVTVAGGVLFVVSDTLLAFRLFSPWAPGHVPEFLVMLTYLAAQSLIAVGVLLHQEGAAPGEAPRSRPRLAPWQTQWSRESEPDTFRMQKIRASRSPA